MTKKKRKLENIVVTVFVLIASVLVASLCITQTVCSREKIARSEMEGYYQMLEKETVRQVRSYLNDNGFTNSGVTLTRVVDEEENRHYTLTVHHGKIDKMDEEERESLGKDLEQFYFAAEHCTFCHEFLVTD